MKEKKDRWEEDTMITVSRDTRAELKILAALSGLTIKDFLAQIVKEKKAEHNGYKSL